MQLSAAWILVLMSSLVATVGLAQDELDRSVKDPDPSIYKLKIATYPFNRSEFLKFDPYEVCNSPTQSPNCVAKTVWVCQFPAGPASDCVRVGFAAIQQKPKPRNASAEGEITPQYKKYMSQQFWRRKWGDPTFPPSGALTNIRPMLLRAVGPDRFKADPPLPQSLIGTHEMIIYAGETPYLLDGKIGMSVFMKQVNGEWQATSYSFNGYKAKSEEGMGRTEAFFEQCEDYGCGESPFATAKTAPRRTTEECKDKMCAYRALGIPKPIIPMPDEPPWLISPIFMPGIELECLHTDKHPMCRE